MKSILVVLGTRPEAIKLAPLILALRERERAGDVKLCVCSTAQHREMLDDALAAFQIVPDRDLALMRANQGLGDLVGRMAIALQPVLDEERPDVVVVQGDTTTVMVAALVGFLGGAQVAHVEAGLRTEDKRSPFPEEVNRRIAGVVADHHFAPTQAARAALLAEGVADSSIRVTGNTGIDALFWMREKLAREAGAVGEPASKGRRILVTAHRRESFGQPLREVFLALREILERFEDVSILYPVHLNPNVQGPAREILGDHARVELVDPLPYAELTEAILSSTFVVTDSGGIQEEAPSLGKPVLVLRDKTERPEAVHAGVAKLLGTDRAAIVEAASALLSDEAALAAMSRPVRLYGDGLASARIVESLVDGRRDLADFEPTTD